MGKDKFFTLVPERVNFSQFWVEIRKRNRWLIMLRYGAVIMLTFLIIGTAIVKNTIVKINLDVLPLILITLSILVYNIVFHYIWVTLARKRNWGSSTATHSDKSFHSLHFSLIQIIGDMIALLLFIYFTGGVESPLYAFFIFHVIIGSLFLTQEVTGGIVTIVLMLSITGALLEFNHIIPHHAIEGLLISPLYSNTGYVLIFFSVFGITLYASVYLANNIARELYLRERDLTKAYNDLENAEKTKSRYVQSVVHDLKTPIAAAVTYLNMILEGNLGEVSEPHLKPLERSKTRLTSAIQTINDILQISQLKIESSIENIVSINLNEVFEEIISEVSVIVESKKIEFNYHCNAEDSNVEVEPKLIKLVLANIVSNAVKYTEDSGKIELILSNDKDFCSISIADNGIGIPEKEQEKIFQSFYRSSVSKQLGIEGTGLGMTIVWEVIQKYHGSISLVSPSYLNSGESRPGTQFIIKLPKIYKIL